MKNNFIGIGMASLFLMLAACGTLDKQECLAGDWQGVGYHDGAQGRRPDVFTGLHNRACTKHGVAVDEDEYERGHALGLVDYCQPAIAYRLGRSAERYNYLCPVELQESFLTAYADGLTEALYQARFYENRVSTRSAFIRSSRGSIAGNQGGNGSGGASAQPSGSREGERSDNARHKRIQIEIMLDGVLSRLKSMRADRIEQVQEKKVLQSEESEI